MKVWHDGTFGREDCDKLSGEQRLQIQLGVLPEDRELQHTYYFESLGVVRWPGPDEYEP